MYGFCKSVISLQVTSLFIVVVTNDIFNFILDISFAVAAVFLFLRFIPLFVENFFSFLFMEWKLATVKTFVSHPPLFYISF